MTLTTATPPQSPPPTAPAGESVGSLEWWLRPARIFLGIVMVTASATSAAAAAYFATTGKLDRVADTATRALEEVQQGAASQKAALEAEVRARESADRAQVDAINARLVPLETNDRAQDTELAVLKEQVRQQNLILNRIDNRQEVLLDRLNAPRTRTVRDFPQ